MNTPEDLAKALFPSQKLSEKLVNMLTSTKPAGWSHRSNAPYYKKVYALEIKEAIDAMIQTGENIIYYYSQWCTPETGVSSQTLYNRVNQSIRFLVEPQNGLDKAGIYERWYDSVKVERVRGLGVRISFLAGLSGTDGLKPVLVAPREGKPVWYRKMTDWIEDSDNWEPFTQDNLALSPEEIVDIKTMLSTVRGVQYAVDERHISIIRTSL
jgi:hypothetical protein